MASQLYGEEWDSEEFQTALKVVLKVEIQSLLERLSETGEETVVVTASALDGVTGHLASPNALNFVNTTDIGNVKNKFLHFLTGQVAPSNVNCNNLTKAPVGVPRPDLGAKKTDVSAVTTAQLKGSEKRPFDQGPLSTAVVQPMDSKRRKMDIPTTSKGTSSVTQPTVVATNSSTAQPTSSQSNKNQPPKLKTTKVVSKKGGFTEERISDAEFKKFLAQYKPAGIPEADDDDDSEVVTGSQIHPSQKQVLPSVQNTQGKGTGSSISDKSNKGRVISAGNQPVKTQNLNQSSEIKKDNSVVKSDNSCVKDDLLTEIKEEVDPDDIGYQTAQTFQKTDQSKASQEVLKESPGQIEKSIAGNKTRNRVENIDSMDTAALIEMTKAKHLESMSPADREIHAKLGQISSKLSWVVEYPKDKKGQPVPVSHSTPMPRGPEGSLTASGHMMEVHAPFPHSEGEDYEEMDDEEFDDDDDEDEDDFNEDDLDEEDKAKLKALREEHMRKLGGLGGFKPGGSMYAEGYEVSRELYSGMGHMMGPGFHEDYGEDDEDEDYENYDEEMGLHMQGPVQGLGVPNLGMGHGEGLNVSGMYHRTASPTSENYLMIGPIMAKCLICNKIVRKTEMKLHNETHLGEVDFDEDEEGVPEEELEGQEGEEHEGEEEFPGEHEGDGGEFAEEGEYSEEYALQDDQSEEPVFTAEKFVAEKLVAEKLEDSSVEMAPKDESQGDGTVCDICGKSFKTKNNMQRHKKNVHPDGKVSSEIQCPCCSKTLKPASLKNHLKKMHPDFKESSLIGTDSEISADSYKCGMCGEEYATENSLQEHAKDAHS